MSRLPLYMSSPDEIDDMTLARRFVMLSHDDAGAPVNFLQRDLGCFNRLLNAGREQELVDMLLDISVRGLSPTQDALVFVFAWLSCSENDNARSLVYKAIPTVLRTPTLQFQFIFTWRKAVRESQGKQGSGWGRGMRAAFLKIYTGLPLKQLAHQVATYRRLDGASQRDVLRLLHPSVGGKRKRDGLNSGHLDPGRNLLFSWAVNHGQLTEDLEQNYYELLGRSPGSGGDEFDVLEYLRAIR